MKKIIFLLSVLSVFAVAEVSAAIPNSTFFVGGKTGYKKFEIKNTSSDTVFSYSGVNYALSGGVRGEYIRAVIDYTLQKEFQGSKSSDTKVDYSSYTLAVEGFKSFDLLFVSGGVHAENVSLSASGADLPSGFIYGVNAAAGIFFGRVSVEFNYNLSLTTMEKNDLKYQSANYQGI
ncbi:hypothetical protein CHS0354_035226, partial [Potamilus streckersoni]